MKDENRIRKGTLGIVVFIIIMNLSICPASVFGYLGSVHEAITSKAVKQSGSLDESLKQIGFERGLKYA